MSFVELVESYKLPSKSSFWQSYPQRQEILRHLKQNSAADVLVVGGGIHGACVAHLAALNGLKVVLLEKNDYASGTSSRSSKMVHGGLRYLELLDFKQVSEGLRARADLFSCAEHLVKPFEFFIPLKSDQRWFGLKAKFGLWLYDFLAKGKAARRRGASPEELKRFAEQGLRKCDSGLVYIDGLMNDSRLVLEHISAARQEGAVCLNYASVVSTHHTESGTVRVGCRDEIAKDNFELRAGLVINCAGPFVPAVASVSGSKFRDQILYSRGSHLLFNKPWHGPALFLPLARPGQYYFVWPYLGSTLVGTTEREVSQVEFDPEPSADEVEEILSRIASDLPGAGLDRSTLYYAFAGIRTLPLRRPKSSSVKLSRRHAWRYSDGMLTLVGGKFTTATLTAYDGLKRAFGLAKTKRNIGPLDNRKLPGADYLEERSKEFRVAAEKAQIPEPVIERTLSRLGSRAVYLTQNPDHLRLIGGKLLRGEVEFALQIEQAEDLEDLMRRRLDLELTPGHGLELLPEIKEILKKHRPNLDLEAEENHYRERIARIRGLLGVG